MKETLRDLKTRRSCRKYRPEQISDAELDEILGYGDEGGVRPAAERKTGYIVKV
ncbi:MAG: hypothetical protein LUH56_06900 [Oscillospiraceae bacterium]|nr:hypothetical protein [Oscillospiraceae bacterium]